MQRRQFIQVLRVDIRACLQQQIPKRDMAVLARLVHRGVARPVRGVDIGSAALDRHFGLEVSEIVGWGKM